MIPVTEARQFVLSACAVLTPAEVPLSDASGHVLAEAVRADEDVPPFANSSMDGYAVRAADTARPPARLRVVGAVMAGDDAETSISTGESVRIMTGAPVPPGADAVCMIERTRVESDGSIVIVEESVTPGTFIRKAGSDIRAGDEVFSSGTSLGPAHVGVLSSIGIEQVLAYPSPTVGVLSTGDELITSAGALAPGQIRDANRPALLARLQADGFGTVDLGVAGDDEAALDRPARRGRIPLRRHRLEWRGERRRPRCDESRAEAPERAHHAFDAGRNQASQTLRLRGAQAKPGHRSSVWPGTRSRLWCPTSCSSAPRFVPWPAAPSSIDRA